MFVRKKLWLGLSAALVTSTTALPVLGAEEAQTMPNHNAMQSHGTMALPAGEGGEGASVESIVDSDSAYLTQLALMRGHLNVGLELYRIGEQAAAATHMKHPEDELYADLIAGFEARDVPGFANQLAALAKVVENRGSVEDANAAYENILDAIGVAENAADRQNPAVLGKVIHGLVKTAAIEYDIAVEEGKIVNGHEYQDALGFVRTAQDFTAELRNLTEQDDLVDEIDEQIAGILPVWSGVVPPETTDTPPSTIYGAAARIEFATLPL